MMPWERPDCEAWDDDRPKPWERKVTICIAATCAINTDAPAIILCSDWLTSNELGSAETHYKTHIIKQGWYALIAGSESNIHGLVKHLRRQFGPPAITEINLDELVRLALRARKNEKCDEVIGAKFGISYEEFRTIGRDKFPLEMHRSVMAQLEAIPIGAEAIVAGFSGEFPQMVMTTTEGAVRRRDDFAAVGEGAALATSVFLHRQHSEMNPLGKTIYVVHEAKKFAEGVPSVGKTTAFGIVTRDGQRRPLGATSRAWAVGQYEVYGPKQLPEDLPFDASKLFS